MQQMVEQATKETSLSPAGRLNDVYLVIKPIADRAFGLLLLALFTPLMLVLAVILRLDSSGPTIFKQTRVGKGVKPFEMYKFRTMCEEAEDMLPHVLHLNEDASGMLTKIKDDPRVTNVGRVLRATSLDELPQLINVVKGDMSLVGPRPPLPSEVALYDSCHMRRLEITPGITGLWQVSGRKNLDFDAMVDLDIRYAERQSMLIDLWIILKTIPEVLKMNGAR